MLVRRVVEAARRGGPRTMKRRLRFSVRLSFVSVGSEIMSL